MTRASAWLLSLGLLACGTPASPPTSTSAQRLASTGAVDGPTKTVTAPEGPEASLAGPGTVEISEAKVGEGVDASNANAVLKRRAGFTRMCYAAALADSPKLAGSIDLRLTLGGDGKVIEIGVPESSLDDDAVEACLTRGLEGLRFAAPEKAPVAVDVSFTFKLK